jgi:3-deoxy-D-manno-octulosonic-acid transferase
LPYLLNLIYVLLILLCLPWLVWQSIRKGKYREGYAAKFLGRVPTRTSNKTCVWLHAVSVGEVNLLATLLKEIEKTQPDWECVISTTTTTGMELAKKKYAKYTVFYCPLDFTWAVHAAMQRIRPNVLVLAELELWPNLIRAAKRHGAKVAVVNGRLGEKSFRGYSRIRPLVAGLLREMDLLACQDEACADRFLKLGARPETVVMTGSLKYDGAQTDRNNPATQKLAALAGIEKDDIVILAGSTQEPEEAMVLNAFRELSHTWPQLRLILVPRHPDRFDAVAKLLDTSGLPWQRRTALQGTGDRGKNSLPSPASGRGAGREGGANTSGLWSAASGQNTPHSARILLVDVVGELGAWWGTANIGFVGGSMGSRGGQNMIEPAAYGAAVSFGPNTWNFRDIVAAILAHDAAVVVSDERQFTQFVRRCLKDRAYADLLGNRAQAFVRTQLGATTRTMERLTGLVG